MTSKRPINQVSASFNDWNDIVLEFHRESDRGAALLAAGYVEHQLGSYLKALTVDESLHTKLFGGMGPMASFSQKMACARAFNFISAQFYRDLDIIRLVRNHFAHHPLKTNFESTEVTKHTSKLRRYDPPTDMNPDRKSYLLFCGYAGFALDPIHGLNAVTEPHLPPVGDRDWIDVRTYPEGAKSVPNAGL